MVISIEAGKVFGYSTCFHDKITKKTRNRKKVPQYNKEHI